MICLFESNQVYALAATSYERSIYGRQGKSTINREHDAIFDYMIWKKNNEEWLYREKKNR
jgi:hypothetical protein